MSEKRGEWVSVARIKEAGLSSMVGFLHWHMVCPQCRSETRLANPNNPGSMSNWGSANHNGNAQAMALVSCGKCGSKYKVNGLGETLSFRETKSEVVVRQQAPSTAIVPRATPRQIERRPAGVARSGWGGDLLGRLIEGASRFADDVASRRLVAELSSTGPAMASLHPAVKRLAMVMFVSSIQEFEVARVNWSADGQIEVGVKLQKQAREMFNLNQAESYATWLVGSWLESGARKTPGSNFVHEIISQLRDAAIREMEASDE